MTNNDELALKLKAAAEKATAGEWWFDVVETDGEYGDGEDRVSGFHSYAVYVDSESLLDMTNSTAACIHEEWDGEYRLAWDEVGQRNAEFIATANPANILALLAERDADKKRIAELEQKADIYDMLRTDYELEGSLVDFVDWQAKRIEMLELYTTERDAQNQDLLLNIGSLQQRIAELETVCAESYQVVGALGDAAGVFETSEAVSKALDNLSDAKLTHDDVLPFVVEARTVSVKLPPVSFFDFKAGSGFADGAYVNLEAMNKELRKAGINLEVGE